VRAAITGNVTSLSAHVARGASTSHNGGRPAAGRAQPTRRRTAREQPNPRIANVREQASEHTVIYSLSLWLMLCNRFRHSIQQRSNYCLLVTSIFLGRSCPFYTKDGLGILETPNFPGEYPATAECHWRVRPGRNKRVLVIISNLQVRKRSICRQK